MFYSKNRLLTIDDVATMLQVSKRTVFRWFASGKLQALRVGNVTRIRPEDLDQFIQDHLTTATRGDRRSDP